MAAVTLKDGTLITKASVVSALSEGATEALRVLSAEVTRAILADADRIWDGVKESVADFDSPEHMAQLVKASASLSVLAAVSNSATLQAAMARMSKS